MPIKIHLSLGLHLLSCLTILFATSCATVDEPRVVSAPQATPVSPAALNKRGLKKKLVIARFSNETLYGKSVLLSKDLIARQASDMLATKLVQAGNLLLFHRSDPKPLLKALDAGTINKMGLNARYLVVGSVTEFGREITSKTGVFSRTKMQKARARVNVRLIDVASARVIYGDDGVGEAESEVGTTFGVGTKAGYDSTLNDKAISAAISKLVNNILEKLNKSPWRSHILDVSDGTVLIGGGSSQGIKVGDVFALKQRGKTVKNPQTNTSIELPGKTVGKLKVTATQGSTPEDEFSACELESGTLPEGDFGGYIIEEVK